MKVGQTFESYDELQQALARYQQQELANFSLRDSMTLENARFNNYRRAIDCPNVESIKYFKITYGCVYGPVRGNGTAKQSQCRRRQNKRTNCEALIRVALNGNLKLEVKALRKEHNHPRDPELFRNATHNRKLSKEDKKQVVRLFEMGAKTKLIREYYMNKTGKPITAKDLQNIKLGCRNLDKKKSTGGTSSNQQSSLLAGTVRQSEFDEEIASALTTISDENPINDVEDLCNPVICDDTSVVDVNNDQDVNLETIISDHSYASKCRERSNRDSDDIRNKNSVIKPNLEPSLLSSTSKFTKITTSPMIVEFRNILHKQLIGGNLNFKS